MQQEIIFNPNHILEAMKEHERVWNEIAIGRFSDHPASGDRPKRAVIFSQLLGFAQRCAPEPVKQDIRQGVWYLMRGEETELRARSSRFNIFDGRGISRNYLVDVSLSDSLSIDGIGYKFAATHCAVNDGRSASVLAQRNPMHFSRLVLSKNSKFLELVAQLMQACSDSCLAPVYSRF